MSSQDAPTNPRIQRIIQARKAGESLVAIAEREGVSRARIHAILTREAKAMGRKRAGTAFPMPKRKKAKPPAKPKPEGRDAVDAATALGVSPACLIKLCEQGRIPFAKKQYGEWRLPTAAVKFARRFPPMHGIRGKQLADQQRREAAALDPECLPRQKAHAKLLFERLARQSAIAKEMVG